MSVTQILPWDEHEGHAWRARGTSEKGRQALAVNMICNFNPEGDLKPQGPDRRSGFQSCLSPDLEVEIQIVGAFDVWATGNHIETCLVTSAFEEVFRFPTSGFRPPAGTMRETSLELALRSKLI